MMKNAIFHVHPHLGTIFILAQFVLSYFESLSAVLYLIAYPTPYQFPISVL